ncbi:Aspartic protease pep1 like protein [Zymoseptoria brevis]|uniref:Aspartic protease pep1 like protein n=1 Tax=Zymoseptoria brevis TaxID=1047168 RepID=A0A0F4G7D1_9PEZI|nr:Aspartic protease pep1 like protein [Zymoseptoria brevis]
MRDLLSIAAIVASAAAVPAVPAGKGTFSIPQVLAGHVVRSPPIEMLETYHKYLKAGIQSIEIPADVSRAAEAARLVKRGSVQANPDQYDSYYVSPVNVGGTVLNMVLDTGSADSWAYSKDLPANVRGTHHVYTPSSSAKQLQGYTWGLSYNEGSSVSGIVYSDTVVIGGITAHNQAVEVATKVSAGLSDRADVDGLLGLGFKTLQQVKPTQQNTIFDTIKSQLAKPLFTVDLKVHQPGSYDFGYIDPKKHKGIVTYVPVDTHPGYWKFTAGAYSAGSGKISGSVGVAFVDSGTTFLWLPAKVVTDYYSHVPNAKYHTSIAGWTFPCKGTVLPDFHVRVGSQTFTVPGSIINYGPVDDANSPTCFGQIVDNQGMGGQTIFGMVWHRAIFVVHDLSTGSARLGFAPKF